MSQWKRMRRAANATQTRCDEVAAMTLGERLTVVLFLKKRFPGRQMLETKAEKGDRHALALLEEALGICPKGWAKVEEERAVRDRLTEALERIAGTVILAPGEPARDVPGVMAWRSGARRPDGSVLTDAEFAPERAKAARLAKMSDRERLAVWYRDYEKDGDGWKRQTDVGRALEAAFSTHRDYSRGSRPMIRQIIEEENVRGVHSTYHPALQKERVDPLASRVPGSMVVKAIEKRAKDAYRVADLRRATHKHVLRVVVVAPGEEGASSESGAVSSAAAGMSRSYQRQARSVATSKHVLYVSSAIFSAPKSVPGALYLRPDLRVVSGRGTALKVEARTARGAWKERS